MKKIASKVTTSSEQLAGILENKSLPRNFDCIEDTVKLFSEYCFNINKVRINGCIFSFTCLTVLLNILPMDIYRGRGNLCI